MKIIPFVVAITIVIIVYILVRKYWPENWLWGESSESSAPNRIVNYYMSWCGYSQKFLPIWSEFKEICKKKYPQIVCEEAICDKDGQGRCKKAGIKAYPNILLYKPGAEPMTIQGYTQLDDLLRSVERYYS